MGWPGRPRWRWEEREGEEKTVAQGLAVVLGNDEGTNASDCTAGVSGCEWYLSQVEAQPLDQALIQLRA